MGKRKARSPGLKDFDIISTLGTLKKFKDVIHQEQRLKNALGGNVTEGEDEEEDEDEGGPSAEVVLEKLGDLISVLGAKFLSVSNTTFKILRDRLNIALHKNLVKRGDHIARAQKSATEGGETYMSSKHLHDHLNLLQNLVPRSNEANARLCIDAMFLRASAMLSGENRMTLNHEHTIPQKASNGLFVTQAKLGNKTLIDHIPQAVAEMYGAAAFLNKETIRGALSNGHEWLFVILTRNKDGYGGTYRMSPVLELSYTQGYPEEVRSPGPDLIAGILSYWAEHGFESPDSDDWFE